MAILIQKLECFTLTSYVASYFTIQVLAAGNLYWRNGVNSTNAGEYLWLDSPHSNWVSSSRTNCIRGCVRLGDQCGAVEFEQKSGSCTAGNSVTRRIGAAGSRPQQPEFYSRGQVCAASLGFSSIVKDNERTCMYVSTEKVNRDEAVEICKQKGARLYVMKTIEKYQILSENRDKDSASIWIGLKDLVGNKTFVWEDDGEQFKESDPLWDFFWESSQPTYTKPLQQCVGVHGDVMKYYDITCDKLRRYACETDLF